MKIMMVCLGNICRSPLAHGILQARIDERQLDWQVESSGTSSWHSGEGPDQRSVEVAAENGIDISRQRSQQFRKQDLQEFDHVIVMDSSNYNNVMELASTPAEEAKVSLLLNYSYPGENRQVPDPYYAGGFPFVFDLVSQAVDAFIEQQLDV